MLIKQGQPRRLALLGGFTVEGWRPPPSSNSPWRIAAYLAIHGPTARRRIAGLLWPEAPQDKAQACLRSGLWRIQSRHSGTVESRGGFLALGAHVSTDLTAFCATVRRVLASETCAAEDCLRLVAAQELAPEWSDEWIETEREQLRQSRLRSPGTLGDRLIAAARFPLASQVVQAELRTDPLREVAHQRMIRFHLAQGDLAQAWQSYEDCARMLRAELGIEPSAQTRTLLLEDSAARARKG